MHKLEKPSQPGVSIPVLAAYPGTRHVSPPSIQARSFAGILTAMITRPSLHRPVRDVDGLLAQEEVSWVVEGGIGVVEYMQVLNDIQNFICNFAARLDYVHPTWFPGFPTRIIHEEAGGSSHNILPGGGLNVGGGLLLEGG